jgi:hypothetical protein
MNAIALRRQNEIFFLWGEPVPATEKPFTSTDRPAAIHEIYTTAISTQIGEPQAFGVKAAANFAGKLRFTDHDAMLKMAKKFAPDQSWFDEDFTDLRHPGR